MWKVMRWIEVEGVVEEGGGDVKHRGKRVGSGGGSMENQSTWKREC